jgi:hypothetical protein
MAALSIFFIVILLIMMVLAVSTELTSAIFLIFGQSSYSVLVGLVILSFPILIFVMITIVILVAEDYRATRKWGRHWWLRPTKYPEQHSTIHVETHKEERDR